MLPAADDDVDAPHFLPVAARLVHDAQPDPQRLALVVPRDEFVDGRRIGQRRQPHSICEVLAGRQLVEDDLAQHPLSGVGGHERHRRIQDRRRRELVDPDLAARM